METPKLHIALLASPGMGHVIPLLELSKHLVTFHSVHATLFVISTTSSAAQSQLLQSSQLPEALRIVDLPPPDVTPFVTSSTSVDSRISIIVRESLPAFRAATALMPSPPAALMVDIFGFPAFDIADQLEIPKYMVVTSTARFLALTIYVPTLDQEVEGEYVDLEEPIQIPGCKPVRVDDIVDPMLAREHDRYRVYVEMGLAFRKADGLLVNTWEDLEPLTLTAVREGTILGHIGTPRVYPVGPLVRTEWSENGTECFDWLDMQPNESVLYVSFGSGGTLSQEQVTELAWGLELSKQRFIWVIRPPVSGDASGKFFSAGSGCDDPSDYLPEGFLSRIQGVGMVVPEWAPQIDILRHRSTGGFLSHCGWNSTLESITNGVPMIAWPLYAEQRLNASMVVEDLGVATRSQKLPTKVVVSREEIEGMVRLVMEGEEGEVMRAKMRGAQIGALKAIEENGSSYNNLVQLLNEMKIKSS